MKNRFVCALSLFTMCSFFSIYAEDEASVPKPSSSSSVDFYAGKIHAALKKNNGSVGLYYAPLDKREKSLLSTADESSSSYFSVVVGKNEYKINSVSLRRNLKKDTDGCKLEFTDDKLFHSFIRLVSIEGEADKDGLPSDAKLQVNFYVTNISPKAQRFSLKAFFDTILGDNSSTHFTTGIGNRIASEIQYSADDMKKELGITSSDGKIFMNFSFDKDYPSFTTIANKDVLLKILSKNKQIPRCESGRSFSSASSYSNSAIAFNWGDFVLKSQETRKVVFYISVGEVPFGQSSTVNVINVVANNSGSEKDPYVKEGIDDKKETESVVSEKNDVVYEAPIPLEKEEVVEEPKIRNDVDFIVPPVKDYQLDPVYIQGLVDRINSLQSGKETPIDKDEIKRLNAELDAILEKLNSKR